MSKAPDSRSPSFIIYMLIILTVVFPAGFLLPEPAVAAGGTFPASPFNGMQITYSVSGAVITDTKDSEGFTTSRTLRGTFQVNTVNPPFSTFP